MAKKWWEGGCVYQVYPRSFQDSNGDGVGDLKGIERRLDYIAALGVDAIWLSPIFPSPMMDFGYDIADYCGIEPMFGALADFDSLLAAAHAQGLKLLLDFVPNHSSDVHPWFIDSRSSRHAAKRDWYIWRDPAPGGGPPNNWTSDFGGSAWEYDEPSGQYYLHAFMKEQPDLNWRNPELRAAMLDVMRFWLDRGVDGFRIDVLWHILKAEGFPDNPVNPDYHPSMGEKFAVLQTQSTDQPEVHALIAEMRAIADSYRGGDECVLIGEICLPLPQLMTYYGGVHLPFNFELVFLAWDARTIAHFIDSYEAALPEGAWPNWVVSSHDYPRIAARVGEAQARVAAMLLLTLRGTPTLYQGDEIGIGEVDIPQDRLRDPRELREPGLGLGRDASRTPMAWDSSPHGGFSTLEPWLPLHVDWPTRNVAAEESDPNSLLNLYRNLLRLRRENPALALGSYEAIAAEGPVLAYRRRHDGTGFTIALNLSHTPSPMPALPQGCEPLISTLPGPFPANREQLRADEGVIYRER
jgi:oligo-1,6-glucosidase/alpha-glucosidase